MALNGVGTTDEVVAPATEDEARAFEALRAIIRQAVLSKRAKQDDAVNQAASTAAEETEEARQEADQLREEVTHQREVAGAAGEEAAESRGKRFVYEQQATSGTAQATGSPALAKGKEQSASTPTTSGKRRHG